MEEALKKKNPIQILCEAEAGKAEVLQGNIAFAVGCARTGIHSADGYPGTPSTEVIDRGLSQIQDKINVGWSVNEAVAAAVGYGHTLAGSDAVVTMKVPGLFQAGDIFTSASFVTEPRGALVYFIAGDFVPSSTQHVLDPRPLFRNCFVPVFEPRTHQEMLEAPEIAADLGRMCNSPVVVFASGNLCHSEGLVRLNEIKQRPVREISEDKRPYNCLPALARRNYDKVLAERMRKLEAVVAKTPLNHWIKGNGRTGVITYGANTAFVKEVTTAYGLSLDILSLGFTNPIPENRIREFCDAISGDVYVIEDGYRYLQEQISAMGIAVKGKDRYDNLTEWTPEMIAAKLGRTIDARPSKATPVARPPMICAGCPYRLFGETVNKMKKRGAIEVAFGDIGCNSLLYFMNASDTGLAMGASEGKRAGFVLSKPEKAGVCISVIGDSTECHSGLDATRNTMFRRVPGVKVVLDNFWTAMTGGQPAPTSPVNLAGEPMDYVIENEIAATGAKTVVVSADDRKGIRQNLRSALNEAKEGAFTTIVVRGSCIKKIPAAKKKIKLTVDAEKCKKCGACQICPGITMGPEGIPQFTNLCSGCGESTPACLQMCPTGALGPLDDRKERAAVETVSSVAEPPAVKPVFPDKAVLPQRICVAIRGVGGQGNLFFGRVLTQLAFLAGYQDQNIVKGETHGMAQMGGPVISTFSCGNVHSPVLLPGQTDCLIVMEKSEVLRPGFLDLLKPDGIVAMADTAIIPQNLDPADYPTADQLRQALEGRRVVEVDVLGKALDLGDKAGRSANVVMMGVLSKIAPFDVLDISLWRQALKNVSHRPEIWAANHNAFCAGRDLI